MGCNHTKKLNEIGYTHKWVNQKNTMLTPMTVHFIQIRSRYFGTELQNVKKEKYLNQPFLSEINCILDMQVSLVSTIVCHYGGRPGFGKWLFSGPCLGINHSTHQNFEKLSPTKFFFDDFPFLIF